MLSRALLRSSDGESSLRLLEELKALKNPAATWEAVYAIVRGSDSFEIEPDTRLRREMANVLRSGSESQLAELHHMLAETQVLIGWRQRVVAEAVAGSTETRTEWFKALLGTDPLDRLRAASLLTASPAGGLRNEESWALAKYLFGGYRDDVGLGVMTFRGEALLSLAMPAEAIASFFARHAGPGALAIAEAALDREPILAIVAAHMVVEYGECSHRSRAFDRVVNYKWPLFDRFDSWSVEALKAVEGKLIDLVWSLSASPEMVAAGVRALQELPTRQSHEKLAILTARRQPWNREVHQAVLELLTCETISVESLGFARDTLQPSGPSTFFLKRPRQWHAFNRPHEALVELAVEVLERAQSGDRTDVYRRALAARDISGEWLRGASRVLLAARLPGSDATAQREIRRASPEELRTNASAHSQAMLQCAADAPLDLALQIIDAVLATKALDGRVVTDASGCLQSIRRRVPKGELETLIEYVVTAARRYPTATVRCDFCCRFYDSIGVAPRSSVTALRERLAECEEQVKRGLGSAREECAALQRLLDAERPRGD